MPFIVRDLYRKQYFETVPCPDDVVIAVDDLDCWNAYPDFRHIYDKFFIAQSQGLTCGLHDERPDSFPVFAKPRINLHGMGEGGHVIKSAEDFSQHVSASHMWMPLLVGAHISTDCAVVGGEVQWFRQSTGIPWTEGMFKHWTIETRDDEHLNETLASWIKRVLVCFTGMVNIETIGGGIIEAQLRFADQWCDLYGDGFLDAVVRLHATGKWRYDEDNRVTGYSIPLFMRHGAVPPHPPAALQRSIRSRQSIKSLQITYDAAKADEAHTMPPGGFRLAVVNTTDFAAGVAARAELAAAYSAANVILP